MSHSDAMDTAVSEDIMGGQARNAKAAFSRIDADRLARFIAAQPGVVGPVEISTIDFPLDGAGASNGIGLFDARIDRGQGPQREHLVVRYAPGVMLLSQKSYADEFLTVQAAHAAGISVPVVHWLDATGAGLGCPGYVMDRVIGDKPAASMYSQGPLAGVSNATRKEMMLQAATFHGTLRKAAIGADQLPHLVRRGPAGAGNAIERELGWWLVEAQNVRPADDAMLAYVVAIHDWLVANQPKAVYPANLVHGDAQIANLMYRDGQIVAALDWELSYLGHNEADLALLCFITEMQKIVDIPAEGTPTEAEYIAAYEAASGGAVCAFEYFACFSQFKVQAISLMTFEKMPQADRIWALFKTYMDAAWDRAKAASC